MNCRRFVHLALDTVIGRRHAYMLYRINLSGFFPPRKRGGGGADAESSGVIEDARLPRPSMTIYPGPYDDAATGTVEFMPLGNSKDDIVTIDRDGHAVGYGVGLRSVHILPRLHTPMWRPISLTVGGSLYVMNRSPFSTNSRCFEALIYGHRPGIEYLPHCWYWRSLPPPPFQIIGGQDWDKDDQFVGAGSWDNDEISSDVASYTVVNGGSDIWVTQGGKTYSFNTVSGAWSNVGDWALPFDGPAEYDAELKLWFGLSSNDNLLCSSNLNGALRPPLLCNVWKDLAPPKEWFLIKSYIVPLGSSKFCIAKFFQTGRKSNIHYDERFVVLTGVQVERCSKDGLRMVQHRSRRYSLNREGPFCVL